jgi:hypothetical protein
MTVVLIYDLSVRNANPSRPRFTSLSNHPPYSPPTTGPSYNPKSPNYDSVRNNKVDDDKNFENFSVSRCICSDFYCSSFTPTPIKFIEL